MDSYFLDDYKLNCNQTIYSCFVSEYGLQHIKIGWNERNITHGLIGLFELVPLIGPILSIFEKFLAPYYKPFDPFTIPNGFVRYTLLHRGSQMECCGPVEVDKAKEICQTLNQKSTNGIYFSESKITDSISDGTCSAMAFNFANRYLEMRKSHTPKEIIKDIGDKYRESNQEFRTTQAAFNAIGKGAWKSEEDFKQAKIEAMLHFYNRKVVKASEAIDIQSPRAIAKMQRVLSDFKEGVYVLRTIKPAENDKGELMGHSTVFIRDGDEQIFYEPCSGFHEIEKGYETTSLCSSLAKFSNLWTIHLTKVYQIA